MGMTVGIIGQGFVGTAICEGLKGFYQVLTYDLVQEKCNSTLENVCNESDVVFVCVPTPMHKNGKCDTRILEKAIDDAYNVVKKSKRTPVHSDFLNKMNQRTTFVIKSTVPPGTTSRLAEKNKGIDICFRPEFLTEANSIEDFRNQSRIIIGGTGAKKVKQMFRKAFPEIPIIVTKSKTAEMVKYFTNCFLATKVTFANQMYAICNNNDIDYDKVSEYALYDDRIGKSHLAVPGPDGDMGFGGHCFPKDLSAMIYYGDDAGTGFLQAVEFYNNDVRTNRDWETMKGRAVSDD